MTVVTSVKRDTAEPAEQLLASEVELTREGEEITVYRFRLTEAGGLVAGSVHSLFKELRSRRDVMTSLSQLFALTVALAGLLAAISLWTPRRLAVKADGAGHDARCSCRSPMPAWSIC